MKPSLLEVKKIQVTKLSIEALASSWTEQPIDNCEIQIFRHQQVPHAWIVTLTVFFGANRQTARYAGAVSVIGEFATSKTISDLAAENLVNVNAPTILYSTVREMILTFTSRSPNGAWILPSVSFIDHKRQPELNTKETPSQIQKENVVSNT